MGCCCHCHCHHSVYQQILTQLQPVLTRITDLDHKLDAIDRKHERAERTLAEMVHDIREKG